MNGQYKTSYYRVTGPALLNCVERCERLMAAGRDVPGDPDVLADAFMQMLELAGIPRRPDNARVANIPALSKADGDYYLLITSADVSRQPKNLGVEMVEVTESEYLEASAYKAPRSESLDIARQQRSDLDRNLNAILEPDNFEVTDSSDMAY